MTSGLSLAEALQRLPRLGQPLEVTELPGGLTNHNYRVRTPTHDVVVRISPPGTELLAIDREHEWHNSTVAASVGVGAPVVEYLPGEGVLVVGFLPGRTYGPDDVAANLPRVAAAARRLHGGPEFASRFDMFEVQRGYLRIVRDRGYAVPEGYDALAPAAARVEAALASRPEPLVPCHNDLLAANVLDDGGDLRFIDYEYSGMNDACFELGNIWSESNLSLPQLDELVGHYYGENLANKVARARLWGLMSKYGWTLWASIQDGVSHIDFDFWTWGMEKYDRAVAEFDGPDFDRLVEDVQRSD